MSRACMLQTWMARLGQREKMLLAAVLGCTAFIGLIRVAYLPITGRIAERRATVQQMRVKIADAQVLLAQLPQQEAAFAQARLDYENLQRWLKEQEAVARILESLSRQAKTHHVELIVVQSPNEEAQPPLSLTPTLVLRPVPLELALSGRYRNIGEFLGGLAGAPFAASVQSVQVRKADTASAGLKAQVSLAVFVGEEVAAP